MNSWVNAGESVRGTVKACLLPALAFAACLLLLACSANSPGNIETLVAQEAKRVAIAGKDLKNQIGRAHV